MNSVRRGVVSLARPPPRPVNVSCSRLYASAAFVPPASNSPRFTRREQPQPPKPESPSFFTGRPQYYDSIISLQEALSLSKRHLQSAHLYPFAGGARPTPSRTAWKNAEQLVNLVGARLRIAQYRQITALLNELNELRALAEEAGSTDIEAGIAKVLAPYEREDKEAILGVKRRPVQFDEFGRSYTLGKRKESSARVWIVPTQGVSESTEGATSTAVPSTNILINNTPVGAYFPNVADRERVVLPFKLTGLVGAFNAFVLTRGGGTTGQAGAAAHGIAKGLAAHVPEAWSILMKAGLLRRDPRMVERKKTGLAKARKRYAWVKR